MRYKLIVTGALLVVAGISAGLFLQPSLGMIHKSIEREHQSLRHISADEFQSLNHENVVLFDVREPDEFSVSHIKGAIQLPPTLDADEFSEDYADLLQGKTAIFYCSVGRRSSDMLVRLSSALEEAGVQSSANLTGGIFNWVNQEKALVGEQVHPYNDYWGRLISDQSKVSYSSKAITSLDK